MAQFNSVIFSPKPSAVANKTVLPGADTAARLFLPPPQDRLRRGRLSWKDVGWEVRILYNSLPDFCSSKLLSTPLKNREQKPVKSLHLRFNIYLECSLRNKDLKLGD